MPSMEDWLVSLLGSCGVSGPASVSSPCIQRIPQPVVTTVILILSSFAARPWPQNALVPAFSTRGPIAVVTAQSTRLRSRKRHLAQSC